MANILRIGLLLATLSIISILVQPTEADDVKKKRVVIKVPTRIKHVYHHHTKKIHIYKKKPKTKPVSEHVIHEHVEEESQIRPVKSWKYTEYKKKNTDRYKRRPKKHYEYRPPRGFSSAESQESVIDEEYYPIGEEYPKRQRKPRRPEEKKLRGKKKYRTKKPKVDYIDDYEDKVWPERKEHPSWHQTSKTWTPEVTEEPENWTPKPVPFRSHVSHIPDGSIGYRSPEETHRSKKSQRPHEPEEQELPGSGYRSQISHSPDGSVGYRSHVGHSNDSSKPSSSFQSVSFGQIRKKA